jgi:hypothetical protein
MNTNALISPVRMRVLNTTGHSIECNTRLFRIRKAKNIAREEKNRSSVKMNHLGTMFIVRRKLIVLAGVVILGRFFSMVKEKLVISEL